MARQKLKAFLPGADNRQKPLAGVLYRKIGKNRVDVRAADATGVTFSLALCREPIPLLPYGLFCLTRCCGPPGRRCTRPRREIGIRRIQVGRRSPSPARQGPRRDTGCRFRRPISGQQRCGLRQSLPIAKKDPASRPPPSMRILVSRRSSPIRPIDLQVVPMDPASRS